ncbi:adenylate-forming enzyme domain protein [Mycobacterium intracellulare 1956]|uniref:Adenylate-forming enzyme domain protein n=1 Tax=Mycobacterium intracellulare 1956 TaxID=1299331 RepID=X8CUH9_MYCIT|nr:adenylate-forming enzyme domain protein [Mycobacterium intracellulare 1956]
MSVGGLDIESSPAFSEQDPARFREAGWWCDTTLSDAVRRNAAQTPKPPRLCRPPRSVADMA